MSNKPDFISDDFLNIKFYKPNKIRKMKPTEKFPMTQETYLTCLKSSTLACIKNAKNFLEEVDLEIEKLNSK